MTAEVTANPAIPNTTVLIHGLWMTPLGWELWVDRYEARGFRVFAPAWPRMDGDIDELRRDPSGIERLYIREIVDHYAAIVRELARRSSWATPLVVHSRRSCSTVVWVPQGWRSTPLPSRAS